ncbi:MAG: 4-hydroxythreonine-4-phosphate dehydrogenase PdxA [Synergistales bacterium]|nr:4-hydroxythreonine-4-phosphate dehydrogenase PdxA [Synergistales bacterium]
MNNRQPIAVTMGDPAGVGPEIALQSLREERVWECGRYLLVGDLKVLKAVRDRLGLDVGLQPVDPYRENIDGDPSRIPVMDLGIVTDVGELKVGQVSALAGRTAVECISTGVDLARRGLVKGIATTPINKEALKKAGYHYIGHTEMLAELSESSDSVTMFLVDSMKIFFHSRHMSLKAMIEGLSVEGVLHSIQLADRCLASLSIEERRLALAALNPHASDGGLFGDEEARFLAPAVEQARKMGIHVSGPVPADSVFHMALNGKFDAVISLYHDQGHIAAKTYEFYKTVSVTFGLPFIRTSVDHGTAFDIAWKGVANPVSMEEAIVACCSLADRYNPDVLQGKPEE